MDPEVHATIRAQIAQENSTINLIASENTVTRASVKPPRLTNKYAEGYPGKLVADASPWTRRNSSPSTALKSSSALTTPMCGRIAERRPWLSTSPLKPGDTILSMSLDQGGSDTAARKLFGSSSLSSLLSRRRRRCWIRRHQARGQHTR